MSGKKEKGEGRFCFENTHVIEIFPFLFLSFDPGKGRVADGRQWVCRLEKKMEKVLIYPCFEVAKQVFVTSSKE